MSKQSSSQTKALFHAQRVLTHLLILLFFHAHGLQNLIYSIFRDLFQGTDDLQVFPAAQMSVVRRRFYEGTGIF